MPTDSTEAIDPQKDYIVNNRFRASHVARQLAHQLEAEYKGKDFTTALLDNLGMLFMLRKKLFSYMEFLKNVHIRHEYDEALDDDGSPQSFVHESVLHSAILYACNIIGKDSDDFGSIQKFALKNWANEEWRVTVKPDGAQAKIIDRIFHLRNKLIGHIDLNLDQVITEKDVKELITLYDEYIVKIVGEVLLKFLGHDQRGNFDFQDMSVRTYALLYPRDERKWIKPS